MYIKKLAEQVRDFFKEVVGKEARIIGATKEENGWLLQVETLEESEYMRTRGMDDLMGLYEVKLNNNQEIISYKRVGLRKRNEVIEEDDE